jgi:hypothetical protein
VRAGPLRIPPVVGVWFEEGGYLPSESEEEAEEAASVAQPGTESSNRVDPELSSTTGAALLPVEAASVRLSGKSVFSSDHEEGEVEWKKPDLSGWDPKPELVLYGGVRSGLGGIGSKVVGDSAVDLATLLHSEDQRKRKGTDWVHGPPARPGYLKRNPHLSDLPQDHQKVVEERKKRDQERTAILQIQYDHGLKQWLFPTGRVANSQEVQRYHAAQAELEYQYGQDEKDSKKRRYKNVVADRGLKQSLSKRSNKPPS